MFVDEAGFNSTQTTQYGWVKKFEKVKVPVQRFDHISIISAITMEGKNYFSLVTGTNDAVTFSKFMEMLAKRLDQDDRGW